MLESGFRTAKVVREGKGRETKQPLVNARHLKQVPERKGDVRHCQWIAQLLQYGLLINWDAKLVVETLAAKQRGYSR
jgi:hypothetical protein